MNSESSIKQRSPIELVPESIADELMAVASKKEKAKAKRKAFSENTSEEEALCAILHKAAGKYSVEKFIAHRKFQRENQAAQLEQQRQRDADKWKGWFDGAAAPSNPGPRGVGSLLVSPSGERFEFSEATGFGTNNEAEYQALIALLDMAAKQDVANLVVYGDSQLVINQVNGDWDCQAPKLYGLMRSARSLVKKIKHCELRWIPREKNVDADALSKKALGVSTGEGGKKSGRKSSKDWGTQTDIGKILGISAIAVGKILDACGLRDGKIGSVKALDSKLAKNTEGNYGVKTEWNVQLTAKAIEDYQAIK